MKNKTFDIHQWIPARTEREEVEIVLKRIEANHIDLTADYADWCRLGFAFAHAFGEEGRMFYHRLSAFYPGYQPQETDRQYDACLKSRGEGVTLKTFFHMARMAGIDIHTGSEPVLPVSSLPTTVGKAETEETAAPLSDEPLPTFSGEVKGHLPALLSDVVSRALSSEDADMLLLGSLTCLSACLPGVSGVYGERRVYPNLFLFVAAPASSGKGRLTLCQRLVLPVHQSLRRLYMQEYEAYQQELARYQTEGRKNGGFPPQEPPVRMLILPANSSSTAVFQTLNDNGGSGLIFETEGDTLTQTFRSEHGNYSDGLRKAFHHENISYNRRANREYVDIAEPRLSVVLSGTPRQVLSLIPDAENGLASRFLFYGIRIRPHWADVFACSEDETLDARFDRLGQRFFHFYERLQQSDAIRFVFTPEQVSRFNDFFAHRQDEYYRLLGESFVPSIRRLGLITYRVAMILSTLRLMELSPDEVFPSLLTCSDTDFDTALRMATVLLAHSARIHTQLMPTRLPSDMSDAAQLRRQFFDSLPAVFTRPDAVRFGKLLSLSERQVDKCLRQWMDASRVQRRDRGQYAKLPQS